MKTVLCAAVVVLCCVVGCKAGAGFGVDWGYEDDGDILGPENWYKDYPACGTGAPSEHQSPIDIPTKKAVETKLPPLNFRDTNPGNSLQASNLGSTIQVDVPDNQQGFFSFLDPRNSSNVYILAQFHFHWSDETLSGSEHTINNLYFPVELHMVHYLSTFPDISTAIASQLPNALSVVGVMYGIGAQNTALTPLTDIIPSSLHYEYDSSEVSGINLSALLPPLPVPQYFDYDGSLTTPGCDEVVQWLVLPQAMTISQSQLDAFRSISHNPNPDHTKTRDLATEVDVICNARPIQPLNDRTIISPLL
ncbi:carbonic anhydrase 7 [Pelomyxa schiedti]|nr:carbonic anhydrase 7 [Pelomyxa schiedti]